MAQPLVLNLRIRADAAGAGAAVQGVERDIRRLAETGRALSNTLALVGVGLGAQEIIRYADGWKSVEGRLRLVTQSTSALAAVQRDLYDLAQRTRSGYEATADVYGRMARSTRELGLSQQGLLRITETVNKAVQIAGGSAASAEAALFQLGQAMAAGALRGDELNSVLEQAPRLAQAIAAGMGVTIGQLRSLAEQGKLTSEAVVKSLQGQAGAIDREFAQLPTSVGAAMTTLQNALMRTVGEADTAIGATAALAEGIEALAGHLDDVAGVALTAGAAIGTALAGRAAAQGVQTLVAAIERKRIALHDTAAAALEAALAEKRASAEDLVRARAAEATATATVRAAEAEFARTVAAQRSAAAALAAAEAELTAARAKTTVTTNVYVLNRALAAEREAAAQVAATSQAAAAADAERTLALRALQAAQSGQTAAAAAGAAANMALSNASVGALAAQEALAKPASLLATAWDGAKAAGAGLVAMMGGPLGIALTAAAGTVMYLTTRQTAAERAARDHADALRELGSSAEALDRKLSQTGALVGRADRLQAQGLVDRARENMAAIRDDTRGGPYGLVANAFRFGPEAAQDLLRLRNAFADGRMEAEAFGNALIDLGERHADDEDLRAYIIELLKTVDAYRAAERDARTYERALSSGTTATNAAAASFLRLGAGIADAAVKLSDLAEKARLLRIDPGFERRLAELTGPAPAPANPELGGAGRNWENSPEYRKWAADRDRIAAGLRATMAAEADDTIRKTRAAAAAEKDYQQAVAGGNAATIAAARAKKEVTVAVAEGALAADRAAEAEKALAALYASEVTGAAGAAATALGQQADAQMRAAEAAGLGEAAARQVAYANRLAEAAATGNLSAAAAMAASRREEAAAVLQIRNETVRGLQLETANTNRLAQAVAAGAGAVRRAQEEEYRLSLVRKLGTDATVEGTAAQQALNDAMAAYRENQAANDNRAYQEELKAAADNLALLRAELGLLGESESVRERTLALIEAERDIRERMPGLTDAQVEALLREQAATIDLQQTIRRQLDAWQTLTGSLERAFDRIGDSIVQAFVEGNAAAVDFGGVVKGVIASILSDLAKLAIANPIRNALFGAAAPTLWDLPIFGGAGTGGGPAAQGTGIGAGDLLSYGSKFLPSSWTNAAANLAAATLGIGGPTLAAQGAAAATMAEVAAADVMAAWGVGGIGAGAGSGAAAGAASTMAAGAGDAAAAAGGGLTAGGSAIMSVLGPAAAGFGLGLLPGMFGASKPVSAGIGALGGAGAGFLIGGPVGAVVGGVAGLLGGLLGGGDPGPPAVAAGNLTGPRGLVRSDYDTDNKGDPAAAAKMEQALNSATETLRVVSGAKYPDEVYQGIEAKSGKYKPRIGDDDEFLGAYDTFDEAEIAAFQAMVSRSLVEVGDNVATAAKNSTATTLDEFSKDLDLARRLDEASTALDELDTSLAGIETAAKKAAAANYETAIEEVERADKLGLGDEYRRVAATQIRASFETTADSFSPMETAMATLRGQADALKEAIQDLGLAITDAEVDAASAAKVAKLQDDYSGDLDATLNTLSGEAWRNNVEGFATAYETTLKDIAALWGDGAEAGEQVAKAQEIVRLQFVELAQSGTVTEDALRALSGAFPEFTAAINDAIDVVRTARAIAIGSDFASVRAALQTGYTPTAQDILAQAGVDPNGPALRWVSEALDSFGTDWAENVAILTGADGQTGLRRQLEADTDLTDQQISAVVAAATQVAQGIQEGATQAAASVEQAWSQAMQTVRQEAQEAAAAWERVGGSLAQLRQELLFSEHSPLSPRDAFDSAQQWYRTTLAAAQGGDLAAAERLQATIEAYLDANATLYGSANPAVFEEVRSGLESVETVAEVQARAARDTVSRLDRLIGVTDGGLAALQETLAETLRSGDFRDYGSGPQGLINRLIAAALPDYSGGFGDEWIAYAMSKVPAGANLGANTQLNAQLVALGANAFGFNGAGTWGDPFLRMAYDDPRRVAAREILRQAGYTSPGFRVGGVIPLAAYAVGGVVGNGVWDRDSVLARYAGGGTIALAGGEGILTARATAALGGAPAIAALNRVRTLPVANDRFPPQVIALPHARGGVVAGGAESAALARELRAANRQIGALTQTVDRMARMLGDQGAEQIDVQREIADGVAAAGGRRKVV
ncbi:tape measure protein [Azospirillum sp. A39]|uniref:tape measure protein n=1 Tax=Azospirillum sp. A39 TaxID=3462279 RepID=UPI004045F28F